MALIGDIRKRSGLLVIIIGVALAAFVLGDFIKKGPKRQSINIGVVAGEEIPALTFNQRVEENLGFRRQNLGRENLTPQEQFSVRQSTWDEMVNEALMAKQYKAVGINVSVEELDDLIRGANPHSFIQQSFTDPQTGVFNPELVDNFLTNLDKVDPNMRQRYIYIEKAVKNDRFSIKYRNLVSKAYYVPDLIARFDHTSKNRQKDLRSVIQRYQTIPDEEVTLDDKDLKAYYEKNKFRYKQDEMRSIDYVVFDVQPSAEDRELLAKEIEEIYQEFQHTPDAGLFVNAVSDRRYDSTWFKKGSLPLSIDDAVFNASVGTVLGPTEDGGKYLIAKVVDFQSRPDSMRASHILVSYQGAGVNQQITRTKERAQQVADSLFNVVQKSRFMFKIIAATMSDDATAAQKEGDLNWFVDGGMVFPFNNAVFKGKVGDLVQVETQFGFHIIEITGKKDSELKARVALVERDIEPSTKTIQESYVKASQFSGTNRNAVAFEKAVTEMGLSKRSADDIQTMDNTIGGINTPREIIRWAFNSKTQKGDVSPAFELEGSFVVVLLREVKTKGTTPFEQSKQMLEPLARRDKKAEKLIGKFEDATKSNSDIYAVANSLSTTVDTLNFITFNSLNLPRYGRDPKVVGKIFAMDEGQLSKPIAGDIGVYLIQVDKITHPEPDEASLKSIKGIMLNSFRNRVSREAYTAIEKNAEIEDNRLMYY